MALESMASGVPIIATKVSDNAYVVPDGRVGYLIESGDETALADRIVQLAADARIRARMAGEARAWVLQEFSGKRLAEKTADVYDEALRLKKGRRSKGK